MASYFLDTSALAKHYHVEPGTPQVEQILHEPDSIHFCSRFDIDVTAANCLSGKRYDN